jgi:nucleotide-binding universal stress UspA family protein
MKLGTVFVPTYDKDSLPTAMAWARALAAESGATLVGLHVQGEPSAPIADYYWNTEIMKDWERGVEERASLMKQGFSDACGDHPSKWLQRRGDEYADLGAAARTADLIVTATPELAGRNDATDLIEAIMIGSGRPVLIAPSSGKPTAPRKILAAWNGSIEAARALAVARPLLADAEEVSVLTVGQARDDTPEPEAVAEGLRLGGIKATGKTVKRTEDSVGATIMAEARNMGADAVLIGAYSRSRFRERILGGVTRKLIKNTELPIIMVH